MSIPLSSSIFNSILVATNNSLTLDIGPKILIANSIGFKAITIDPSTPSITK